MVRKSLSAALVVIAVTAGALVARAQDQPDPAKIKAEILEKVRAKLEEENKKILERIEKVIDEALARAASGGVSKEMMAKMEDLTAQRDELAKKVAATEDAAAKKDLQKQLDAVEDQRDDVGREIRTAKREMADADLRKESENLPNDPEIINGLFNKHIQQLTDKDYKSSIAGFKKIYYRLPDERIGATSAYNVACAYSLMGEKDEALDWVEIAIDKGWNEQADYDHMRKDTDLDNIRQERRFQKIMLDH